MDFPRIYERNQALDALDAMDALLAANCCVCCVNSEGEPWKLKAVGGCRFACSRCGFMRLVIAPEAIA